MRILRWSLTCCQQRLSPLSMQFLSASTDVPPTRVTNYQRCGIYTTSLDSCCPCQLHPHPIHESVSQINPILYTYATICSSWLHAWRTHHMHVCSCPPPLTHHHVQMSMLPLLMRCMRPQLGFIHYINPLHVPSGMLHLCM